MGGAEGARQNFDHFAPKVPEKILNILRQRRPRKFAPQALEKILHCFWSQKAIGNTGTVWGTTAEDHWPLHYYFSQKAIGNTGTVWEIAAEDRWGSWREEEEGGGAEEEQRRGPRT